MSDTESVGSKLSVSNVKIECPKCHKNLQTRALFNHIRSCHLAYFQDQTRGKWLEEAATGLPLKIHWEKENDQDGFEIVTMFACLGSNKVFTTEQRASTHFKKNPKDLKEHNKQVFNLLKERTARLEEEARKNREITSSDFKDMKDINHPDLIEAMTNIVDNLFMVCERLCKDASVLDARYSTTDPDWPFVRVQTVPETIALFLKLKDDYDTKDIKSFKYLSSLRGLLERVLKIRKHFNGHTAPEAKYAWYISPDHPEGALTKSVCGDRFLKLLFPFDDNYPLDWS